MSFILFQSQSQQQWPEWTKGLSTPYSSPPSTGSSSEESPMEFTPDTEAESEKRDTDPVSSPSRLKWIGTQPVCMQQLMSTVEGKLHCPPLDIAQPSSDMIWEPTPPPAPGSSRIKPSERKVSRSRPARTSDVSPGMNVDTEKFLRILKGVADRVDRKTMVPKRCPSVAATKKPVPSTTVRPALMPLDIPNSDVEQKRKGKEKHADPLEGTVGSVPSFLFARTVSVPLLPPPPDAMDVDTSPAPVRAKRSSDMPPPHAPPPKRPHLLARYSPPTTLEPVRPTPEPVRRPSPKIHPTVVEQQPKKMTRHIEERESLVSNAVPELRPPRPTTPTSRPPSGPPVLGMRRTYTASYSSIESRPLPVKQQGFKPPLLSKQPSSKQAKQSKEAVEANHKKEKIKTDLQPLTPTSSLTSLYTDSGSDFSGTPPDKATEVVRNLPDTTTHDTPIPGSPTPTETADSSFGDVSLDVNVELLEEVMKEFDKRRWC